MRTTLILDIAALAIEYQAEVHSNDSDFSRFSRSSASARYHPVMRTTSDGDGSCEAALARTRAAARRRRAGRRLAAAGSLLGLALVALASCAEAEAPAGEPPAGRRDRGSRVRRG